MSSSSESILHVVAGILTNAAREILVAMRPAHVELGGLWEFPGGKVEPGETIDHAVKRELKEEIGIVVQASTHLIRVQHTYTTRKICLDAHWILDYEGNPTGNEGQQINWISPDLLSYLKFPTANNAIVKAIQFKL